MPTYDYKCQQCEHTFEYFQAMSDARLENCPECEGKVRRLVSGGSGLIFKGSGFYLTDYAKKDSPGKSKDLPKPEKKKKKPEKESAKP
ncbi:MAG: zinc ribbon domain-containing protein [Candidatus Marinimicrobia bacterium]|nr:zinc ribbon domain-containing protein [Candidatus Neomarinimicrobiota bacterium]MDP6612001.1 zinc ribbon domain-containing protein [Candidatus Neomarinimicrobiota bacterium]